MKKLYVSVPTEGRTHEAINNSIVRMHKVAEAIFDENLQIIATKDKAPKLEGERLNAWLVGESMQVISKADYFIGIYDSIYFEDCSREAEIARRCGIPTTFVSVYDIAKDAVDIAAKDMIKDCFDWRPEFVPGPESDTIKITLLSNDPDWEIK